MALFFVDSVSRTCSTTPTAATLIMLFPMMNSAHLLVMDRTPGAGMVTSFYLGGGHQQRCNIESSKPNDVKTNFFFLERKTKIYFILFCLFFHFLVLFCAWGSILGLKHDGKTNILPPSLCSSFSLTLIDALDTLLVRSGSLLIVYLYLNLLWFSLWLFNFWQH